MDVRAKQLLSFHVVFLLSAGLVAVSPHVISAVMPLRRMVNYETEYFVEAALTKSQRG